MTPRLALLLPGDPEARTGGYAYDRRIVAGLRARGWSVAVETLSDTFPFPTPAALADAARVLDGQPEGGLVLVDGLAFGAMPAEAAGAAARLRLVALVHHPLALESGLMPAAVAALEASERAALASARHVVVTSRGTAAGLAAWGVAPSGITVIEPGTDPAPPARGSGSAAPHLVCVATVAPRKGYDLLIPALAALRDRPWQLTCVGSLTRDPEAAAALRTAIAAHGLDDRVRLAGEMDEAGIGRAYDGADVFVLASRHEGYGMAVAEALARGLPVVATATGGIGDLLAGGAGIVVPPGDLAALTGALARVLDAPALRERLAEGARACRTRLPSWDEACDRMAAVLTAVGTAV